MTTKLSNKRENTLHVSSKLRAKVLRETKSVRLTTPKQDDYVTHRREKLVQEESGINSSFVFDISPLAETVSKDRKFGKAVIL